MNRAAIDSMVFYRFASLDNNRLAHAVSTRLGGISPAPYDSLNIGLTVGDKPERVHDNTKIMLQALEIAPGQVVTCRQVHGRNTARVGPGQEGTIIPDCDALVTNARGIFLLMRFADCVPVLLWDPQHAAIGLAHAGWQGTIRQVTVAAVERMQAEFCTQPQDLFAALGPSIGPCCLEVGPEVVAEVRKHLPEAEQLMSNFKADGHAHLDIWQANREQLRRCGVRQIEVASVCTCCHQDEFYSYRASRGVTGRFGAVIGLR